jgi:chromosome segregation ATPase
MKPSADMVGPVDRKEIAEIEAHAGHLAEMERKHGMDAREMERIKEQAKREAARAADLAKPAAVDAEKAARADQKRRTNRNFNKGSQKQLDELRRQLEILEREREKLGRQIEQLERQQEQLDEQRDEDQGNDAQEEPSNFNPESVKGLRK